MLAISRALMSRPRLLLLDEPSLGLAPILVQQIFKIIRQINKDNNTTIFLVEQNANLALKTAHKGYVMETGKLLWPIRRPTYWRTKMLECLSWWDLKSALATPSFCY